MEGVLSAGAFVLVALLVALASSLLASLLACIPSLHIYNVLAVAFLGMHALAERGIGVPGELMLPALVGLVVGWALNNGIPSILLGAADESAVFTVLPGQAYLMAGRGYEAVMLTAAGGLGGLLFLVAVAGPMAPLLLPTARAVLSPHFHWMLWCVICFMLMAEWPKGGTMGQGGWPKFLDAWRSLAAGLAAFLLSGVLGFILMYRSPVAVSVAFQNLMPAFVGLFALPWLLLNIASATAIPEQQIANALGTSRWTLLRGIGTGIAGGGFAAFVPGVTGGIGGMLAGHATAQSDDRAFLVSQGASKAVYYVGAFLLLFVPGAELTRGGAAWMTRGVCQVDGPRHYSLVLGSIAVAGAAAFLSAGPLARLTIRLALRWGYRWISGAALAVSVALVFVVTGVAGLTVAAVATGIGLIPVLYGSRRMNCLGVILLPLACNMSGIGPRVARALGLLGG